MKLGIPPGRYDARHEQDRNRQIDLADRLNHKKGQDIEVGAGRLIITADDGTRWAIRVTSPGGAVQATQL